MPEGQPIELHPPLGGVRGDLAPWEIPPGFLWRSQNFLDRFGRLRTRPGLQAAASTGPGARVSGGQGFTTNLGIAQVVAASGTKWKKLESDSWTDISGAVTFTNDPDNPTRFTVFPSSGVNYLIGVNNMEVPYQWDGVAPTITALGGSPPIAKDVTVSGNFVILGNVVESGVRSSSRIRVSDFNDLNSWAQYGPQDLTDTNDDIVAVRALTRTIFAIYKTKSVWVGYAQLGLFPFAFETIEYVPGPVSPAAIVRFGQRHYYFATDGRIYRFDGSRVEPVSLPVEYYLLQAGLPTQFRSVNRARCWGVYTPFDRRVWFFYPGPSGTDPVLAISINVDTGACYPHVFPFGVTAGWDGDDIATLAWSDLTGTWDAIGPGTYPTWDSFGGTLEPTAFIGSTNGQVYRFLYDVDDDGVAIPMTWEMPLKPWLGLPNTVHIDGLESFFTQISAGPLITMSIGASDALAEPVDPAYTIIGTHDTSLTTRQKFNLTDLNTRFWSMRYAVSANVPITFLGGMASAWPEEVPELGVVMATTVPIPPLTGHPVAGVDHFIFTGDFPADYMVAIQTDWVTQYDVVGQTTTQFTVEFGTPPPPGSTIRAKVIDS